MTLENVLARIERGGKLGLNETLDILDEIIKAATSAATQDDFREVAERAQAIKMRYNNIGEAAVLEAESKSLMKLAASPGKFTTYFPRALTKAQQAKEILRAIPDYTSEEKEFWKAYAVALAKNRRR